MFIPRCMSTQHPDNVLSPFFAERPQMGGEDEIQEAYYAYSHLGCDEQMWDCEGKEVDDYVVKKLLTKYGAFFHAKKLGEDVRLTLRVPNPLVEKVEAKVLLETLESIPRSFDAARLFYGEDITPIFEIIVPMTTSADDLNRIYYYYKDFVVGKQDLPVRKGDITIKEWIGNFFPQSLQVIPLFEDKEHILRAADITKEYLKDKKVSSQRVFIARSDPAMNYGVISAVLLNKIALLRLQKFSKESGVAIYPIIGVGSAPFRGNLKPHTIERVTHEYSSAFTFTVQSAFKYDYAPEDVIAGIQALKSRTPMPLAEFDEQRALDLIERYSQEYQKQIMALAPAINKIAPFVPKRRKRKLHIGLFGYARKMGGVTLPRAITFTAALYSLGLPPELLGINALTSEDIRWLKEVYPSFEDDMRDALTFYHPSSGIVTDDLRKAIERLGITYTPSREHLEVCAEIAQMMKSDTHELLVEHIVRAGSIRKFLG
ncbi:MAG: phosphoenolpyruvate carboxylase [Brevinematales bacterium]|nr:phosphoenolpyruvate carboxylase [Brevinematales bacterium]